MNRELAIKLYETASEFLDLDLDNFVVVQIDSSDRVKLYRNLVRFLSMEILGLSWKQVREIEKDLVSEHLLLPLIINYKTYRRDIDVEIMGANDNFNLILE